MPPCPPPFPVLLHCEQRQETFYVRNRSFTNFGLGMGLCQGCKNIETKRDLENELTETINTS